ncbi:PREDICTED: dopamine receptor 1-like [Priapulus caudatus]|uniref:Dopamine receptor 1-like n=1 Tax=Priapulus caudatus TaxID=37621 RepID=A0ABM1DVE7_PRICU|nr:PREDICTED: dopamine receptor 1-like [Priapulus caudatus]
MDPRVSTVVTREPFSNDDGDIFFEDDISEYVLIGDNVSESVFIGDNISEGVFTSDNVSEGVLFNDNVSNGVFFNDNVSNGVLIGDNVSGRVLFNGVAWPADNATSRSSHVMASFAIGLTLSLIIFFAIAGNLLVCVAVYSDRHLRKRGNLFIVSLALADLLVATLVMPFALTNDLLGYWIFKIGFCNVWVSFDVMCSTASILNLCAISIDRYIHIRNPLRYYVKMKLRTVLLTIGGIWLGSILISFIPISLNWHMSFVVPADENATTTVAAADDAPPTCALEMNPTYAIVSSLISFYLPCIVMVWLYARLYKYARKHVKTIKALSVAPPTSLSAADDCTRKLTNSSLNSSSQGTREHKAAITVGVIMGVFLLCWMPFFCINIVVACCEECVPKTLWLFLTWLGYFNSSMNPIIYSIFNTEFREAFKRLLCIDKCAGLVNRSSTHVGSMITDATIHYSPSEASRFLYQDENGRKQSSSTILNTIEITTTM